LKGGLGKTVLTKVTAYSQWTSADPLELNLVDRPETDLFEVRNIDGLGAVKADVNTVPRGSGAGSSFSGTNVGERNLVFTLGLTPDWNIYTISKLRRLLDKYFTPEQEIRFVFESDEFSPVEISGYIESNEPSIFSRDSEQQISVICPEPYFKSVNPIVIQGTVGDPPTAIEYEGNVKTGFHVRFDGAGDEISFWVMKPQESMIRVNLDDAGYQLENLRHAEINTVPGDKYVRVYLFSFSAPPVSILNYAEIDEWLVIDPDTISVRAEASLGDTPDWTLTYYNLFGSL
jgi:hypothetical protein